LAHGDKVVAIKSVINILSLGLEFNDQITLSVDGQDEQEALTALVELFASFAQH
jgi:phosphotransferase system HPr (HPr) family protein